MKISAKARYGLRVCQYLAENYEKEKYYSLPSIAGSTCVSESYLEQIVIPLKKDNILSSVRGAGGGYYLSREPKDISIGEIIRALEEGLEFIGCIKQVCVDGDNCKSKHIWKKLYDGLNELLDSMSLYDMINSKE